jgi:hypothetical protein
MKDILFLFILLLFFLVTYGLLIVCDRLMEK